MIDLPEVFPILNTKRLVLREQDECHIPQMVTLANTEDVAKMLSSMPYPYTRKDAKAWIKKARQEYMQKVLISFAITDKEIQKYMGTVDMMLSPEHNHATLAYWLGRPYWGKGFMSESVVAVIHYGFDVLGLRRIASHHFHTNPASGRVMEKAGMKREGIRRAHFKKGEEYLDVHDWGILREEFIPNR